jgi:hypothetical protein
MPRAQGWLPSARPLIRRGYLFLPSFPRKRESRAAGSLVALDSRFRGNDEKSYTLQLTISPSRQKKRKMMR